MPEHDRLAAHPAGVEECAEPSPYPAIVCGASVMASDSPNPGRSGLMKRTSGKSAIDRLEPVVVPAIPVSDHDGVASVSGPYSQ